jgi:DNA-directed RNA polymerase
VDLMNRVLRDEFVRLHTEFTLASFYEQVKASSPGIRFTKKSAPPALGSLDLSDVKNAVYFFS